MRNKFLKVLLPLFLGSIFFVACEQDEPNPAPTMSLKSGIGLIEKDTIAASGSTLAIDIDMKWNGIDLLKTLTIYYNNEYPATILIPDSSRKEGIISLNLFKSNLEQDNYTFQIVDSKGQSAYLVLIISKDKSGGAITEYKNITIGAQNNKGIGSFLALGNGTTYNLANATINQSLINLIVGYDDDNKTYLASPGADLTNEFDLSAWTTKNTAQYCKSKKTIVQFTNIDSDIILISEFNPASQNEKAKDLKVGDIYSFKLNNNKYGLIKINTLGAGAEGGINCDIKIQK